jgi:uncharacterized protein YlbG (UPF0298 family)
LIDKVEDEENKETPDKIAFSTFKREYGTEFTEKEIEQKIPEMLKFVLEQFHKYTGVIRESIEDIKSKLSEFEKKCLSDSLDDLESKYKSKGLQVFLGFLGKTSTDRIPGGESTPDDPKPITQKSYREQSKAGPAFLKTLKKISTVRKKARSKEIIKYIESIKDSPNFDKVDDNSEESNGRKIIGAIHYTTTNEKAERLEDFGDTTIANQEEKQQILDYVAKQEEDQVVIIQDNRIHVIKISDLKSIKSLKQNTQEQIVNKLKPLIREMLNKGK